MADLAQPCQRTCLHHHPVSTPGHLVNAAVNPRDRASDLERDRPCVSHCGDGMSGPDQIERLASSSCVKLWRPTRTTQICARRREYDHTPRRRALDGSRALACGLGRAWRAVWGECHQPRPAAFGRRAGAASCRLPGGCDQPAAACEIHHTTPQANGGETSINDCGLFCFFHRHVVIHLWGWTVVLNPDGTTTAYSPDRTKVLHSHGPPAPPG